MTILLLLLGVAVVVAQADWWLWRREATDRQDDKVWLACVQPGGKP